MPWLPAEWYGRINTCAEKFPQARFFDNWVVFPGQVHDHSVDVVRQVKSPYSFPEWHLGRVTFLFIVGSNNYNVVV